MLYFPSVAPSLGTAASQLKPIQLSRTPCPAVLDIRHLFSIQPGRRLFGLVKPAAYSLPSPNLVCSRLVACPAAFGRVTIRTHAATYPSSIIAPRCRMNAVDVLDHWCTPAERLTTARMRTTRPCILVSRIRHDLYIGTYQCGSGV